MPSRSPATILQGEAMHICLVSDDPVIESAVRVSAPPPHRVTLLSREGLVNDQNTLSSHGQAVVDASAEADVVLVAWDLERAPEINTLCYHMRRALKAPVVALCRQGSDESVAAIAAGADDAATFPLSLPALRARAVSYHRLVTAARAAGAPEETPGDEADPLAEAGHEVLRFDELRLDRTAHRFHIGVQEVELTPREFALLEHLIENAGTALTRDQILNAVWGINFDTGTNMVDVYMYFLRRKLEAHGIRGIIQTVRGFGYRLAAAESDQRQEA